MGYTIIYFSHKLTLEQTLTRSLRPMETKPVIYVVTVNDGFWDLFMNWLFYAKRAGIDEKDILVIAEDPVSFKKLEKFSVLKHHGGVVKKTDASNYNSKQYIKLVSQRPQHLLNVIEKFDLEQFIYTDVDTVVLKDLRTLIKGPVMFGLDGYRDKKEYYCTGIMYFDVRQEVSMNILSKWRDELSKKNQLNQPLFNEIVGFDNVGFELEHVKPGYILLERKKLDLSNTYLVHANYVVGKKEKIKLLEKFDLIKGMADHYVFTSCGDSPLKDTLQKAWKEYSPRVSLELIEDKHLRKNNYGMPLVKDIMRRGLMFDHFKTYTFINCDISPDTTLLTILDRLSSMDHEYVATGKRWNIQMEDYFNGDFNKSHAFTNDAQDYFVISKNAVDWDNFFDLVIGTPAWDNFVLSNTTLTKKAYTIDLSRVFKPLHLSQTTNMYNSHRKPGSKYNRKIVKANGLNYRYGTTDETTHVMLANLTLFDRGIV